MGKKHKKKAQFDIHRIEKSADDAVITGNSSDLENIQNMSDQTTSGTPIAPVRALLCQVLQQSHVDPGSLAAAAAKHTFALSFASPCTCHLLAHAPLALPSDAL